jgi:3-oxoadipate enol-lactonase
LPEFYAGGFRMFYAERGSGPLVVLLHELGGSSKTWSSIQDDLAAQAFCAVAPDLRGAGQSEVPAEAYSLTNLGLDVLALIDTFGASSAFVIGLAAGGLVALQVAVTAPDRVRGLVLLDTPLRVSKESAAYIRRRAEKVRVEGMHAVVDVSMSRSFPPQIQVDRRVTDAYRARFLMNSPLGYALASLAIADADFNTTVRTLNIPALVLVGEHDQIFTPAQVRELADALPQATFHVIPGAGHFPLLQKPDLVREHLATFLMKFDNQNR